MGIYLQELHVLHGEEPFNFGGILQSKNVVDQQVSLSPVNRTEKLDKTRQHEYLPQSHP